MLILIDAQSLLIVIIVGVLAGWVGAMSDRASPIGHLIGGMIGAYAGIYLVATMHIRIPVADPLIAQIVVATIAASMVLTLSRFFCGTPGSSQL
jgi:uncharacterized membrane protein YeaQ/YmgE (transglycosylase-associated protein family)